MRSYGFWQLEHRFWKIQKDAEYQEKWASGFDFGALTLIKLAQDWASIDKPFAILTFNSLFSLMAHLLCYAGLCFELNRSAPAISIRMLYRAGVKLLHNHYHKASRTVHIQPTLVVPRHVDRLVSVNGDKMLANGLAAFSVIVNPTLL
jgi:hypothetical protein